MTYPFLPRSTEKKFIQRFLLAVFALCVYSALGYGQLFNAPRTTALPSAQISAASADLNSDGFSDLVVGGDPAPGSLTGQIYVLLGKGNGSFQAPQVYQIGFGNDPFHSPYVQQIAVADMNNDGKLDIVVAHNGNRDGLANGSRLFLTILFGNGDGTFQQSNAFRFQGAEDSSVVYAFDIADIDNNGSKDVVLVADVPLRSRGGFLILRNLGNGNFQPQGPFLLLNRPLNIKAAKIDRDRNMDYFMTTSTGVLISHTDGDGIPFPVTLEQRDVGLFEDTLLAGDFNHDGRIDFITETFPTRTARLFINTPSGIPLQPTVLQLSNHDIPIYSEDFDGDGNLDLLTFNDNNNFGVMYGDGHGTFGDDQFLMNSPLPIVGVTLADFDRNGKLDLGFSLYDQQGPTTPKAGVFLNSPNPARYYTDFDGDVRSDLTIFRPFSQQWWSFLSSVNSHVVTQFGIATDRVVAGNYDGDNKADIAVYRDGTWYILQSSDGSVRIEKWGTAEDITVPADYDNDGTMELAVFRPSTGIWWIKKKSGFDAIKWGSGSDVPVPADYDGDGKTDVGVFRPSDGSWWILPTSTESPFTIPFGLSNDKPVPGDYDGDGKADVAVFRPSEGKWYIIQSSDLSLKIESLGSVGDIPAPRDMDGDGKDDVTVFKPLDGTWLSVRTADGMLQTFQWGTNGDRPLTKLSTD